MTERGDDNLNHPTNDDCLFKAKPSELTWGCVKVGENSVKQLTLENCFRTALFLKITSNGTHFMIFNEEEDDNLKSTIEIWLLPLRPLTLRINFCPSGNCAYIGELLFASADPALVLDIEAPQIYMYGCGGYVDVSFRYESAMSTQISSGMVALELGDITSSLSPLVKHLTFRNDGDLPAFAIMSFSDIGYAFPVSVSIQEELFWINPHEEKAVALNYTPRLPDTMYFRRRIASAFNLGVLTIHIGAECLRRRLRRMVNNCAETGTTVKPLWTYLTRVFPHESSFDGFHGFNEHPDGVNDLTSEFRMNKMHLRIKCGSNHEE